MRTHETRIGLFILLVVAMVSLWLSAWPIAASRQQDSQAIQDARNKRETEALDHVPIVDYENSVPSSLNLDPQARALRKAKSARYAKHVKGLIRDREADQGMILTSPYVAPLPALPVGRSTLIALGEVVDSQAYLSDDKTGVYSEFSLRIEEVFKDDPLKPSFPGSLVVGERFGGRVRFPSGRVTFYGNREQGMPRQGRRYVFFFERSDQQYSILTAYELLAGRIYPLDGRNAPAGEGTHWAGDAYEKTDALRFLNDLKRALSAYSPTALEKGVARRR